MGTRIPGVEGDRLLELLDGLEGRIALEPGEVDAALQLQAVGLGGARAVGVEDRALLRRQLRQEATRNPPGDRVLQLEGLGERLLEPVAPASCPGLRLDQADRDTKPVAVAPPPWRAA